MVEVGDQVPKGWYEYEEGEERFWDGEKWTDESRPPGSSAAPQPVDEQGAPSPISTGPKPVAAEQGQRIAYKVLTQKDRFFGGKFDPEKLEAALNSYSAEGWRVTGIATADIASWGSSRQELVVVMERPNDP